MLCILALEEDIARLAPWIGVGWHREGGVLGEVVHERLQELERLLARAPGIRRIADLVGRMEAAERRGRHSERGGHTTVSGVTVGGELAHALPGELALLADDDLEDLFALRLAERRLLSLELAEGELADPRDVERRGPALVCIDTSGSMIGEAEELAKAATLVLLRRVLGEGRRAEVALFGGEGALKPVALAPGKSSLRALFDLLMTAYHGGTDFDGPLGWALDRRAAPGLARADIVVISDGRARVSSAVRARLAAARRHPQTPLRLVFVRIDTTRTGAAARYGPDPFLDAADEVAVIRHDGMVVHIEGDHIDRHRSAIAKPPRTR